MSISIVRPIAADLFLTSISTEPKPVTAFTECPLGVEYPPAPFSALSSGSILSSATHGLGFLNTSFRKWPMNMPVARFMRIHSPFFLSAHQRKNEANANGRAT